MANYGHANSRLLWTCDAQQESWKKSVDAGDHVNALLSRKLLLVSESRICTACLTCSAPTHPSFALPKGCFKRDGRPTNSIDMTDASSNDSGFVHSAIQVSIHKPVVSIKMTDYSRLEHLSSLCHTTQCSTECLPSSVAMAVPDLHARSKCWTNNGLRVAVVSSFGH